MTIFVIPTMYTKSWSGAESDGASPLFEASTLEAFEQAQQTDTMALAYAMPEGIDFDPSQPGFMPRFETKGFATLIAQGREPVLQWAILDVDRPNHELWSSQDEVEQALSRLDYNSILASAGIYSTLAGFRLMWRLEIPVPISRARGFLNNLMAHAEHLITITGCEWDHSSSEPHRMMRTPRAVRDGKLLNPVIDLSPLYAGHTLNPYAMGLVPSEAEDFSASKGRKSTPLPDEKPALTARHWASALAFPWLQNGEPIPPDSSGHTFPVLRTTLAKCAARGAITDPHVLWGLAWESIIRTPGRNHEECWRIACWIAERQAITQSEIENLPAAPEPEPEPLSKTELADLGFNALLHSKNYKLFDKVSKGQALDRVKGEWLARYKQAVDALLAAEPYANPTKIYALMYPSCKAMQLNTQECWEYVKERAHEARNPETCDEELMAQAFSRHTPIIVKIVGTSDYYTLDLSGDHPTYRRSDSVMIQSNIHSNVTPYVDFGLNVSGANDKDLMDKYGVGVEEVIYISGQNGIALDRAASQMHIGIHAVAPIEPVFNQDVQTWLEHLGGEDSELFLDWLAALPRTQEPVAALYLHGDPGIGKSLLGDGLSSLFNSRWVAYEDLSASFNDAIYKSPVVFADEGITLSYEAEKSAAEDFRRYVSQSQHPLRIKYKPMGTAHVALRLYIASNRPDALPFRRGLTHADLEAITERILYIRPCKDTPAVLQEILRKTGRLAGWFGPNKRAGVLAQHLLWLSRNRTVKHGSRFLVQGVAKDWHRSFRVLVGENPRIMNTIAGLLKARPQSILLDAEDLWVVPREIQEHYATYNQGYKQPNLDVISSSLRSLSNQGYTEPKTFIGSIKKQAYPIKKALFLNSGYLHESDFEQLPKTRP